MHLTNRSVLYDFRTRLLKAFEDTYEGSLGHYLSCAFTCNFVAGTTTLSQKHYAEENLRIYGFWDISPRSTPIKPNTRLSKDDCDSKTKPEFHIRYCGIVGSLGDFVTMIRPDLARAWSYLELSNTSNFPAKRTWMQLNTSSSIFVTL